jgi:hypothetical protein
MNLTSYELRVEGNYRVSRWKLKDLLKSLILKTILSL